MKRARVGGAECDAFSRRARRWYAWRPGERAGIKAKANRRERREARETLGRGGRAQHPQEDGGEQ